MGTMPDKIVKPPFLKRLDVASLNLQNYDLDLLISELQTMNLVDVGKKYNWVKPLPGGGAGQSPEEKHLRQHWLNEGPAPGWWPQIQNKVEILRSGLVMVVNLIRAFNRRIDFYWVCAGDVNSLTFEMQAAVSNRQITVLLNTPAPPMGYDPGLQLTDDISIWITLRENNAVVTRPVKRVAGEYYPPAP